jgi:hypothetical protein
MFIIFCKQFCSFYWSVGIQSMPTERPPLVGKVMPTFADRGCRLVSSTDPPGSILGFLDRSRYYFFQVAPQLSPRGWFDPVPDQLLLGKSGSAGKQTQDLWICSQKLWPLDHKGDQTDAIRHSIWGLFPSLPLISSLPPSPLFINQQVPWLESGTVDTGQHSRINCPQQIQLYISSVTKRNEEYSVSGCNVV